MKNTEPSVSRKIESINRYAGISISHFLQAMNKAVTFIQTKV